MLKPSALQCKVIWKAREAILSRRVVIDAMFRNRPIDVIRAEHLGMCFGVRDAIQLALRRADAAPLTILGDLVHNDDVFAALLYKWIATA